MVCKSIVKSVLRLRCWDAGRNSFTHLVRQSQGQLDLVRDSLSVTTALDGSTEERRASPEGGASKAEGAHFAVVDDVQRLDYPS